MDYHMLVSVLEEKLNLSEASPEVKEEVLIHIGDTILERTMLTIAASLSEDEARHAKEQLEQGDIAAFLDMLKEHHPELDSTVTAITGDVINEFLDGSKDEE